MTAPRLTLPQGGAHPVSDVRIQSLQRMAAGGRWRTEAMRSYSSPVLIWFTRGQGRITVAGVTSGYGAHNAIFLPAGTMHGFDMVGQVFGSVLFLPRDGALTWPEEPMHLRLRDARRQAELTGLIDTLERESDSTDLAGLRALHHHAGLLSVFLERQGPASDGAASARRETAADRLVAAFAALVERDFRTPKSVAAYAAELGVTPTHLTRACNKACGRTALDLVGDRKHYEARRRLSETRAPVQDIAADLGFASAAYFTRFFRAQTGMSPTEFRKRA